MPTVAQLETLYRISFQLTFTMFQPIHLVCVDHRTQNVYVLAGHQEDLELEIVPNGEVF